MRVKDTPGYKTSPHATLYKGEGRDVIWTDNTPDGDFDTAVLSRF